VELVQVQDSPAGLATTLGGESRVLAGEADSGIGGEPGRKGMATGGSFNASGGGVPDRRQRVSFVFVPPSQQ
jgi:hypothetical protein